MKHTRRRGLMAVLDAMYHRNQHTAHAAYSAWHIFLGLITLIVICGCCGSCLANGIPQ